VRNAAAIAIAIAASACTNKYAEIEVRDPGRVGVATMGPRAVHELLPADGTERVAQVPSVPAVVTRRGREVVVAYQSAAPLALIDDRNVLPRALPGSGIEVHGRTLQVNYNVTEARIWPAQKVRDDSFPLMLTTDLANVVDAREVSEPRHWPAYVCLPAGILFAVLGTGLLASDKSENKVAGGVYLAGSVPLLAYSVINLMSSKDYKPLDIPGAPQR
jgi:hypothetical protein